MTDQPEPRRVEPTGNPRVDALIDGLVCPSCRTIYNAAKAKCADPWHHDNRPALATGGVVGPAGEMLAIQDGGCAVPSRMDSGRLLEILNASSKAQAAQQEVARLIREEAFDRGVAEGLSRALTFVAGQLGHGLELDLAAPLAQSVAQSMAEELLRSALDTARAEGRRQATEGWDREWGARWMEDATDPTDDVLRCYDEADARDITGRSGGYRRAESRLVGPWEPTEQAGDAR